MKNLQKKVNTLTNQQRMEVANLIVDENLPIATVAREFDISWHAAKRASKRKREIEDQLLTGKIKPSTKRNKTCKFPEVEEELFKWVKVMRVMKFPLTRQLIISKAQQIAENLDLNNNTQDPQINDDEKVEIISNKKNTAKFCGSNGWFEGFKKRFDLHCKKLVGESASSMNSKYQEEIFNIGKVISEFDPENVYNMDEAGLFYQMLPNFSYCLSSEKEVHGTKQKKERVTIIFCCNITGSHKLPLTLIGSSERPQCFRGFDIPFSYFNSPSAWVNTSLFKRRLSDVFLLNVKSRTIEPVLLILDGCSSHLNATKKKSKNHIFASKCYCNLITLRSRYNFDSKKEI